MTRISLPAMCEHIDKRFCIFRGLNSNRKSFAAIFIFGFCHRSQRSHFEQLNSSTISFSSHYNYSCVNPCKFNLHDTKAEVSVLMSINVRSASTPDLQFCCHDSCCRQRLRKQRRMLNNDEDDEMLPKGKFSHWKKKNGEGDGFGSVTPHWQLNLYSPPLYSVDNDWFSFPLDNHVISQE